MYGKKNLLKRVLLSNMLKRLTCKKKLKKKLVEHNWVFLYEFVQMQGHALLFLIKKKVCPEKTKIAVFHHTHFFFIIIFAC